MNRETAIVIRGAMNKTQTEFWGRIRVSQAAASRYELGVCKLPEPVGLLLDIAYGPEPLKCVSELRQIQLKLLKRGK